MNKTTQVTTGKTLCLRGGTYLGKFISNLRGGTVRSAPGEWAVVDGNAYTTLVGSITASQTTFTVQDASKILTSNDEISIDLEVIKFCNKSGNTLTACGRAASGTIGGATSHAAGAKVIQAGNQLLVAGSNTVYRDFEITNSITDRNETAYPGFSYGGAVFNTGSGNSFINLVLHDNGMGIFSGSSSSNTLSYGNVIYNNGGTHRDGEPFGLALYLENASGYSRVYETFALNSFNLNMQGYGVTGPYVGSDIQGSVFAGGGAPINAPKHNLILGPESQMSPTAVVNESHFYHPPGSGYSVNFGYGAGVNTGTFTNNYFFGGQTAFEAQSVANLTFTGNKFYSPNSSDVYTITGTAGYNWKDNTYYNTTTQSRFVRTTVGMYTFSAWKPLFNYDSTSTATSSAMPNQVIVRPNAYQPGRGNIIIYATGATSANVNLSSVGLTNGQGYTIKNAFNWNGPSVTSGTFSSSNPVVSVPLNAAAKSVATPTGWSRTPASTCPDMCLMVVVPN